MIARSVRYFNLLFFRDQCFKKSGVNPGMYKFNKIYPFPGGSKAKYLGRGWFKYV